MEAALALLLASMSLPPLNALGILCGVLRTASLEDEPIAETAVFLPDATVLEQPSRAELRLELKPALEQPTSPQRRRGRRQLPRVGPLQRFPRPLLGDGASSARGLPHRAQEALLADGLLLLAHLEQRATLDDRIVMVFLHHVRDGGLEARPLLSWSQGAVTRADRSGSDSLVDEWL